MCCTRLAENTGCKKSPFLRHRTTLSSCIFAAKACVDSRKNNLLNTNTSSTRPHNMVNFDLLTAEVCWQVWGTPAHFSGFCVLAALPHSTVVVGVSQTFRHWTEGATYIRQGGHHVGHWLTFLVLCYSIFVLPMNDYLFIRFTVYFLWLFLPVFSRPLQYNVRLLSWGIVCRL